VSGVLAALHTAWRESSGIEVLAMLLALAYVALAIKQYVACWYAAFVSSCLYAGVLFHARLYMEAALNLFYAAMAVYGYWCWHRGRGGASPPVIRWPLARHATALAGSAILALASALLLRRYTAAVWPFLDSLVAFSSVYATYLVARKVYENWHWWLAIDALSACLYFSRHLYATTLLYVLYLGMIVLGLREWRRSLDAHAVAT
jgi:nicotinamide mononucleotide transporter